MEQQLSEIQEEITKSSERMLADQEQRVGTALKEIDESIRKLVEDGEYMEISGDKEIDPRELKDISVELDSLLDFLKQLYWKQETLDLFLKYTVASDAEDIPKSENSPEYMALESEVSHLQREMMSKNEDIGRVSAEIEHVSQQITERQDKINEVYLDASNELNSCWELLDELKQLQGQRESQQKLENGNEENEEVKNVKECYQEWESIENLTRLHDNLKSQVEEMTSVRKGSESSESTPTLEKLQELQYLVDLWKRRMLSSVSETVSDLLLFPYTRKVQMKICGAYTLLLKFDARKTHDGKTTVNDIEIYEQNGPSIVPMVTLREAFLSKYRGHSDALLIVRDLTETLSKRQKELSGITQ